MVSDSPSGPAGDMAQPSVESARETAFKALARQTVEGGLTLNDYAEHAVAIQQAMTTDEIDAIQKAPAAGAPAARRPGWLISVFAPVRRRGQWRLRDHLRVVFVFTVQTLDLGAAHPEAAESVVTIITAFGGASVIAPQGVSLEVSGCALFGGRNDDRADLSPLPWLAGHPHSRVLDLRRRQGRGPRAPTQPA
jgi:hypothetical protein